MANTSRSCITIILAAGEGTRMRSDMPKVLHEIGGKPMVGHVIDTAKAAGGDAHAVIVGNQADRVRKVAERFSDSLFIREQTERLGTAHAVLAARDVLEKGYDDVVVAFGDTPLIRKETLIEMRTALATGAEVVVLGFRPENPSGYGRLLMDGEKLTAIREHKECSADELKVDFCNGGLMAFSGDKALELLAAIGNDNTKGEYYMTDAVEIANAQGLEVRAIETVEEDTIGINTKVELARVEGIWQARQRMALLEAGVTMLAPESVHLHHDTVIEAGVVLEPNLVFGPNVKVESGATIRAFSHLEGAIVEDGVVVGPFARLRPGTHLKAGSKVGNFCEVKNALVHEGAKINHLTYIGDAEIGPEANIGAGTITCNYDGANKHKTNIGAGAFIGSNSSLVAPVRIGREALVGSGAVVAKDVPDAALAMARAAQENVPDKGKQILDRNKAIKASKKK